MLTIIITAKDEAITIGRAVRSFLKSINNYLLANGNQVNFEIIVVAGDEATLEAAQKEFNKVKLIKDKNKGKPAAMNMAIKVAVGDQLIFSDGDVFVDEKAVDELLKTKGDLISGRPVPISQRQTVEDGGKYDYWQEA